MACNTFDKLRSKSVASTYLHCSVPCCNSNTDNSPHKLFIDVPDHYEQRKLWLEKAHIFPTTNLTTGPEVYLYNGLNIHFCEDHFEDKFRSVPTRFECQYFRQDPVPDHSTNHVPIIEQSSNNLRLPHRNLKLSQILITNNMTPSRRRLKITVKKKNVCNTSDIIQENASISSDILRGNASISSDKLQENASISSDIFQDNASISSDILQKNASISSDIFQGTSFKPKLVEVRSSKPETPHSHSASKIKAPIIMKKSTPHDEFHDEFTETNKVIKIDSQYKSNDHDETIKVITRINHDHENLFNKCNELTENTAEEINSTLFKSALKEHDYTFNPLLHYYTRNKKTNIQDNFFRGKQIFIDDDDIKINQDSVSAKSTFTCNCCFKKYINKIDFMNHYLEQHVFNKGKDRAETYQCYYCGKEYLHKKHLSVHIQETHHRSRLLNRIGKQLVAKNNAESRPTYKCEFCGVEYLTKGNLLIHIENHHVFNYETDSAGSMPTLTGDYCDNDKEYSHKTHLLNYIKKPHAVQNKTNEETESADSMPTLTGDYCDNDKEYSQKTHLLNYIKKPHAVQNKTNEETESADSMPTLTGDYCDNDKEYSHKTHLLNYIKKPHAVQNKTNEETESADSMPTLTGDYCDNDKEYSHKTHFLNYIKIPHAVQNKNNYETETDSAESMPYKKYYHKTHLLHHFRIKHAVDEKTGSAESRISWICNYCNKKYILMGNLLNHITNKHVVDVETGSAETTTALRDDYCDKEYSNNTHLLNHIKKQHAVNKETDSAERIRIMRCNYCNKKYIRKGRLLNHINNKHVVDEETGSTESKTTLRCNYCNKEYRHTKCLSNHMRTKHVDSAQSMPTLKGYYYDKEYSKQDAINEETDSAERMPTVKCFRCEKEFHCKSDLSNHFQEQHVVDEETDSAESMPTFKCNYCDVEYYREADFLSHVHKEHLDIQEEPLDIKPEIFQCSKCPSSFSHEEDMSKHLRIMHGNLVDLYMENMKYKNIDAKKNKNTNDLLIDEVCEKVDKGQKESQNNFAAYSFAELRIETEIKREFSDPLEDVELPDEQHLGLYPMYGLDPDFPVTQCNFNIGVNGTTDIELNNDFHLPEHINIMNKNLNPETVTIKTEFTESDNNLYFSNKDGLTQIVNENYGTNVIKCRSCQLSFSSQVALLDHIHELVNTKALDHIHDLNNTKAKLYADSKRVLKNSGNGSDKPYLNEAQLMENEYKAIDKTKTNNIVEDVGHSTDFEVKDIRNQVCPRVCRRCSKPLQTKIKKGKCDKICTCKKIEIQNGNRRKGRARIIQIKKCTDVKSDISDNKTKSLRDKQLLENMHRFFINSQKKRAHIPNKFRIDRVDDKVTVKQEMVQDTFLFDDNDLLRPLWEEDEKILVQSRDPTLCKSCLIPLKEPETSEQINTVCDKCRTLENSNEKRRKSNERRRKSRDNISLTNKLNAKNGFDCNICRSKFNNTLSLREHVFRTHL